MNLCSGFGTKYPLPLAFCGRDSFGTARATMTTEACELCARSCETWGADSAKKPAECLAGEHTTTWSAVRVSLMPFAVKWTEYFPSLEVDSIDATCEFKRMLPPSFSTDSWVALIKAPMPARGAPNIGVAATSAVGFGIRRAVSKTLRLRDARALNCGTISSEK